MMCRAMDLSAASPHRLPSNAWMQCLERPHSQRYYVVPGASHFIEESVVAAHGKMNIENLATKVGRFACTHALHIFFPWYHMNQDSNLFLQNSMS